MPSVDDEREAAWFAVHEALPARWTVGLPSQHPSTGIWTATAIGPHPGRGKQPEAVTGSGEDEGAALRDLAGHLEAIPRAAGRLEELQRRQRLVYPVSDR
jgi:hypothetical protein